MEFKVWGLPCSFSLVDVAAVPARIAAIFALSTLGSPVKPHHPDLIINKSTKLQSPEARHPDLLIHNSWTRVHAIDARQHARHIPRVQKDVSSLNVRLARSSQPKFSIPDKSSALMFGARPCTVKAIRCLCKVKAVGCALETDEEKAHTRESLRLIYLHREGRDVYLASMLLRRVESARLSRIGGTKSLRVTLAAPSLEQSIPHIP